MTVANKIIQTTFLLSSFSADKTKVYQGVRVKTTVKELLQKHRALQAQKTVTVNNWG